MRNTTVEFVKEYWHNLKALITKHVRYIGCVIGSLLMCIYVSAKILLFCVLTLIVAIPLAASLCAAKQGEDEDNNHVTKEE